MAHGFLGANGRGAGRRSVFQQPSKCSQSTVAVSSPVGCRHDEQGIQTAFDFMADRIIGELPNRNPKRTHRPSESVQ